MKILNPISQYREYKKEAHERAKDLTYRNNIEKGKIEIESIAQDIASKKLDIIHKKIELLKSLNYSSQEIRAILSDYHTFFLESKNDKFLDIEKSKIK